MSIPIVDLKRSDWDTGKSNPKKGEYVFKNKVYYKNRDFAEGYIHPYKLKWCKYSENDYPRPFSSYYEWKMKYKATPVVNGDDYWPEGFIPDSEGKYVHIDLVLVKIPIDVHVQQKKEAIHRSDEKIKGVKKDFVDKMKGAGAEVSDELQEQMDKDLGSIGI